jgi:hypothetical protein
MRVSPCLAQSWRARLPVLDSVAQGRTEGYVRGVDRVVIPSGAPRARSRGIAIIRIEGSLP